MPSSGGLNRCVNNLISVLRSGPSVRGLMVRLLRREGRLNAVRVRDGWFYVFRAIVRRLCRLMVNLLKLKLLSRLLVVFDDLFVSNLVGPVVIYVPVGRLLLNLGLLNIRLRFRWPDWCCCCGT